MFISKARFLALGAVLLSLTACQAVHTKQSATNIAPSVQATKPVQRQTLVVRGEIVPDEPEGAVLPARRQMASITPAPADPAVTPTPVETPATDPALADGTVPDVTPADQPASTDPTPITPALVDPQSDNAPGPAMAFDMQAFLKDPVAALQTSVGGMPLWLVVAFGLLLIISLVIGFSGPRNVESRDEPAFA
ncbi:MAG: hypothetical protein ACK55V_07180 [Alphaproteobacteria bacterium]|jgi:hypothetical protein